MHTGQGKGSGGAEPQTQGGQRDRLAVERLTGGRAALGPPAELAAREDAATAETLGCGAANPNKTRASLWASLLSQSPGKT